MTTSSSQIIKTAMVLAAGMGTRLRPLTDTMPKPLVNVGGKPVILRTLQMLADAGIERVVINTHYFAPMVESAVKAATPLGMTVHFSYEPELLDTGGGIRKALPLLGDDPFLTVNSDAVWLDDVKPLLKPFMAAFDATKHDVLLSVVPTTETKDFQPLGDFKFVKRQSQKVGQLTRTGERENWNVVFAGLSICKPGLFMNIPLAKFSQNIIWTELAEAKRLYGWCYTGRWREIGSHRGLELARALVAGN